MTLSKGVLTMQQLVLGDSVLTISRDKGLIYTEVGWFRQAKSSKSIVNVDMLSNSETANDFSSFLAGFTGRQMFLPISWRSPPTPPPLFSLATISSSEPQWLTVPWSQYLLIKLRRGTSWWVGKDRKWLRKQLLLWNLPLRKVPGLLSQWKGRS